MVQAEPITWVSGDLTEATIVLSNPLAVALTIEKMTLRYSGPRASALRLTLCCHCVPLVT